MSSYYDIFRISRRLERQHSLFYMVWEMGDPVFTTQVKTAALKYDKIGHQMQFQFNPIYWDTLTDYDRSFLVAHQCLHIILRHGVRIKDADKHDREMVDQTLDAVVNELLVKKFGFRRDLLTNEELYCWMDTLFPDEKVPEDECFEWYFNKLKQQMPPPPEQQQQSGGKSGSGGKGGDPSQSQSGGGSGSGEADQESDNQSGEGGQQSDEDNDGEENENESGGDGNGGGNQPMDDHSGLTEAEAQDIIDELEEALSNQEKMEVNNALNKHVEGAMAGTAPGNIMKIVNVGKVKKKRKWERVIKKWSMRYYNPELIDVEQWTRTNRRFAFVSGGRNSKIMLPSEYETENEYDGKIEVWFFQDTSGSCAGFQDRFFKAALTLPEERFKVRMFCFDTKVYETTLKSQTIYGGGGTCFKCIENYILKQPAYPKALFMITDGHGTTVKPKYADRWHVFLSDGGVKGHLPTVNNFYNLADYE